MLHRHKGCINGRTFLSVWHKTSTEVLARKDLADMTRHCCNRRKMMPMYPRCAVAALPKQSESRPHTVCFKCLAVISLLRDSKMHSTRSLDAIDNAAMRSTDSRSQGALVASQGTQSCLASSTGTLEFVSMVPTSMIKLTDPIIYKRADRWADSAE